MADLVKRPPARGTTKRSRQQDRGPLTEYLAFCLAGEVYAAPVSLVREILKPPPLTPVPRAPFAVMGIVSVRGQLVTVYDMRKKLRLAAAPASRKARILLVEAPHAETLGLFVDEVLQVYRLSEGEIELTAAALGGEVAPYISGIARPAVIEAPAPSRSRALGSGRGRIGGLAEPQRPREPAPVRAPETPSASVVVLLDLRALLTS